MQTKNKRRRYAAPIGGLFIGLAVIGVISVVALCIRLTFLALDNTSAKERFSDMVLPLVMFNPPPFEQATDIEMPSLLLYSMWSTLLGEKGQSYQFSAETGELIVPASDLDVAAARLFGPSVTLEHQTFGEFDSMYLYDDSNATYAVTSAVQYNVYTPSVEEITKNGEYYELRVGYIASGITWQTDFSGGEGHAAPEKYMNYILQKSDDSYFIVKLQDPVISYLLPPPEESGEAPAEQQPAPPSSSESEALSGEEASSSKGESDASSNGEEAPSSGEEEPSDGEGN